MSPEEKVLIVRIKNIERELGRVLDPEEIRKIKEELNDGGQEDAENYCRSGELAPFY